MEHGAESEERKAKRKSLKHRGEITKGNIKTLN